MIHGFPLTMLLVFVTQLAIMVSGVQVKVSKYAVTVGRWLNLDQSDLFVELLP